MKGVRWSNDGKMKDAWGQSIGGLQGLWARSSWNRELIGLEIACGNDELNESMLNMARECCPDNKIRTKTKTLADSQTNNTSSKLTCRKQALGMDKEMQGTKGRYKWKRKWETRKEELPRESESKTVRERKKRDREREWMRNWDSEMETMRQ